MIYHRHVQSCSLICTCIATYLLLLSLIYQRTDPWEHRQRAGWDRDSIVTISKRYMSLVLTSDNSGTQPVHRNVGILFSRYTYQLKLFNGTSQRQQSEVLPIILTQWRDDSTAICDVNWPIEFTKVWNKDAQSRTNRSPSRSNCFRSARRHSQQI